MTKKKVTIEPQKGNKKTAKTVSDSSLDADFEKEWQATNAMANHWKSDLDFFKDELYFFKKLVDKYFIWLTDEENIQSTRKLVAELAELEKNRVSISQKVDEHLIHFADLVKNPFAHDAQQNKNEHAKIEKAFSEFVKTFREVKTNIFQITENVIDSEKAQHLLT